MASHRVGGYVIGCPLFQWAPASPPPRPIQRRSGGDRPPGQNPEADPHHSRRTQSAGVREPGSPRVGVLRFLRHDMPFLQVSDRRSAEAYASEQDQPGQGDVNAERRAHIIRLPWRTHRIAPRTATLRAALCNPIWKPAMYRIRCMSADGSCNVRPTASAQGCRDLGGTCLA